VKTPDYDALIAERSDAPAAIAARKEAARLAEIARNQESLRELAESAAREADPEPGPVDPEPSPDLVTSESPPKEISHED
jgi:hypothetical protein